MRDFIKKVLGKRITAMLMPYINKQKEKKRTQFYSQFVSKDDLCFDVGANIGNRIKPFLNLGARVVAVEPQEACCKILKDTFGDKIVIVQKGAGAERGEQDFFVADSPIISSFSAEWIEDVKKDRFKDFNWGDPIKVEITTIDDLIAEYGAPQFVKIDVEGYELLALQGLSQPVKALSFEYTVPEQTELTIDCLRQIQKVAKNATFNYSPRETMSLAFEEWIGLDAMIEVIKSKKFEKTLAGDIYARSNE